MKSRIDPESAPIFFKWRGLSDVKWVAVHIPRFERVRARFEKYQAFLETVLEKACQKIAPLAVIEGRTKSVSSFAEKILRKRKRYEDDAENALPPDPMLRVTDLCGVRVVVQTAEAVRAMCKFVEEAFEIDRANSEDASQRLKPTEFGYRSVHYIVQIDAKKLKTAGISIPVPSELRSFSAKDLGRHAGGKPLKAEIQVRTLLEHAAASLGHDSIYKPGFTVPDAIKRHHATLAAMLENVDTGFARLLASLKAFESSYGAYRERKAVEEEIQRLRIVLGHAEAGLRPSAARARSLTAEQRKAMRSANIDLAMRIARHALAIGRHETAKEVLEGYDKERVFAVQRTLGQTLTEMHWDDPKGREYRRGRRLLEAACAQPPKDSETLCLLAETIASEDSPKALDLFHEAIQADPTEPITLARYLEFEIERLANDHAVRLSAPMIRNAMERCDKQIEARVNLPAAWASLAFFDLLIGKPHDALHAIAHVGALCEGPGKRRAPRRPCAAGRSLKRLRESLRHIGCLQTTLEGYDWCERAVLLLLAARVRDREARKELRGMSSWKKERGAPHFGGKDGSIVILSGACVPEEVDRIDVLRPHLLNGCKDLSFKLLCGGTTAGIGKLAGDIAEASDGAITAFGYLPDALPRGAGTREDTNKKRYARCFTSSPGAKFTPLDALQGWTDLIAGDVDPKRVKVLAYAGGENAHAECAMAVALGARVGIIENRDLPGGRRFDDRAWQGHANLAPLPMDAMTFRAFIRVDQILLDEEQRRRFERAARKAHEDYVQSATPPDRSSKKWEDLDESLKLSNFHQVAYWESMLGEFGIGVRPMTRKDERRTPLKIEDVVGKAGIKRLAEMEHGRWNVERLFLGWRHATNKDVVNKRNPCLVAWPALRQIDGRDYQPYDKKAIRAMPENLRAAGLWLYRK